MKGKLPWFALGALVLAAIIQFGWRPGTTDIERIDEVPPRQPRSFAGVVRATGEPVAGARVVLYEEVEDGFVSAPFVTGDDGRFEIAWRPTGTTDAGDLLVCAQAPGYAPTVAPARAHGTRIDLALPAPRQVAVFDTAGQPLRAQVHAQAPGPRADPAAPLAQGEPVDILVACPGFATRYERRFRGGEQATIHLRRGYPVTLRVRDPAGRPVAAEARLDVPPRLRGIYTWRADADGVVTVDGASDGGMCYLRLRADGYLPVGVPAWPGGEEEVVMWPARTVKVLLWDGWNSVGVDDPSIELDIDSNAKGDWWGGEIGKLRRPWPLRPGKGAGVYLLTAPACACKLRFSAPGYGDTEATLSSRTRELTVRLQPPSQRDRPGQLALRAAGHEGRLRLVVIEPVSGWTWTVALVDGNADIDVVPDANLRLASAEAANGVWLPQRDIEPVRRGERRVVRLALQPATRLHVRTEPLVAGTVAVTDLVYRRAARPHRAPLRDGAAEFWVRPLRRVKVEVKPEANYFPLEGEFETERTEMKWTARLRAGSGIKFRIRDQAGHPIPFGLVRLWEPGVGGEIMLRRNPKPAVADAAGVARLLGLHAGQAAVEVIAPGFRTRRPGMELLPPQEVADVDVAMGPAGLVRGRIVDEEGAGRGGLRVSVIAPLLRRLPTPNGGERLLYDLATPDGGAVQTAPDGSFVVTDAASRGPLLAVRAGGQPGIADAVFDVPEGGDPLVLPGVARIELAVGSGAVEGVYLLLPDERRAVLFQRDPPMGLRPLPLALPAGRHSLYVRMRDGRWAAPIVLLKAGRTYRVELDFH